MKRIKYLLIISLTLLIGIGEVYAAPTNTMSVSSTTIENGSSVTVSLKVSNTAAWNIKLTATGAVGNCSNAWADATSNGNNTTKTFSVTCKSTSVGIMNFTFSGDATSSDGSNVSISQSKTVNVKAATPKSTNNYLSNIAIDNYELSPSFNKTTLEYNITVPATTYEININATKEDSTANINGTGTQAVVEGNNTFKITVTAQDGTQRVYTLNVNVEDTNPIKIIANEEEFTLIKNTQNIETPELFEETTVIINDLELKGFKNEATGYVLVAVRDSKGNQRFLIYNDEDKTYQQYNEVKNCDLILNLINLNTNKDGYSLEKVIINNYNLMALKKANNTDFVILKAMNMLTGEEQLYQYDMKEDTYQRHIINIEDNSDDNKDLNMYKYTAIGFAILSIFLLMIITLLIITKPKKNKVKKLNEKKDDQSSIIEKQTELIEKETEKKEDNKKLKKKSLKEEKNDDIQETEEDKKIDVKKLMEDYEKTLELSKTELDKQHNLLDEEDNVEDMYNFFNESKKNTKKKKSKKS